MLVFCLTTITFIMKIDSTGIAFFHSLKANSLDLVIQPQGAKSPGKIYLCVALNDPGSDQQPEYNPFGTTTGKVSVTQGHCKTLRSKAKA